MVDHQLTGLSVADTDSPVQTYEQLGGTGTVFNKALAIPMHLGYPWQSLEYVVISPVAGGQESSVGEHLQHTDEIYYIQRGMGVLTTNGISWALWPGTQAQPHRRCRWSSALPCRAECSRSRRCAGGARPPRIPVPR
jgi:hypothetical protein